MEPNPVMFEKVSDRLKKKGVDTSTPGFCNDARFLEIEREDPAFLFEYGRFVIWKNYDAEYLKRAEERVLIVAEKMHEALVGQNLQGGCVLATMMMQAILERHEVWSCIVKGGLIIDFPGTTLESFKVCPINFNPPPGTENFHSWVFAPPFMVVDVTIALQDHSSTLARKIPQKVLSKDVSKFPVEFEMLIDSDFRRTAQNSKLSAKEISAQELPIYTSVVSKEISPFKIHEESCQITYIPTRFGGADGPLNTLKGFEYKRKSAWKYYLKYIKPELDSK